MKEEALLIASRLDTVRVLNNSKSQESVLSQAQAMIRRLVEELDKQKPLSDEEIGLITTDKRWSHIESPLLLDFARAIEERHGIK